MIYGLVDPQDMRVRYVGKTECTLSRRLQGHLDQAKKGEGTAAKSWVQGLLAEGVRPQIIAIEEVLLGVFWAKREEYWISHYRAIFPDLLNIANGGAGPSGIHLTDAAKQKAAAATRERFKDPKEREKQRLISLAYWTPEARAAQSKRAKAQFQEPEALKMLAEHGRIVFNRQDVKDLRAAAIKDPAYKSAAAEKTRAYFQKPGSREKQSQISKARFADPAMRAKVSAIKRAQWADPEYRAAQLEKRKHGPVAT